MPMAFNELAVLWTYHEAFPSKYEPSVAELADWDDQLVAMYDGRLTEVLTEMNLSLTRENKSRVLMLTVVSAGSAPKTQVRNACRFYVHARDLDMDVDPNP